MDLSKAKDTHASYLQQHHANRLPEWAFKKRSMMSPYLETGEAHAPWRFQWIIKNKLACMAWAQYAEHMKFLLRTGIRRIVSVCPECRPATQMFKDFYWIEIPIEELGAPTIEQINIFMCFCEQGRNRDEAVAVMDRVGRGRSGTLAACYLIRYGGLTAEQAISQIRKVRPGAIDTMDQEDVICCYYGQLCACPPDDACWQG